MKKTYFIYIFILLNQGFLLGQFSNSNIISWYRADSAVTTLGFVDNLLDLSGNNFHASQSNTSFKPLQIPNGLNNKPVIRFDGSNDFLVSNFDQTYSQPNTIFIVWKTLAGSFRVALDDLTNVCIDNSSGSLVRMFAGIGVSYSKNSPFDFIITTAIFNQGTSQLFENGNLMASGNVGSLGLPGVCIGKRFVFNDRFFNGEIAEIIIFDEVLSTNDRLEVENYLRLRYTPGINLGNDIYQDNFCPVPLFIPAGYSNILWSNGATSSSINVTEPGIYWVQAIDRFGYLTTDTIQFFFPSIPQPVNTAICVGESNTWNADMGAGYTYLWSTGATTPSINISTPGTYSVTVTGPGGCSRNSGNYTFSIDNYSQTAFLGNDTSLCSGNLIALQVGAAQTVSYLWPNGATTPNYVVDTTGNYFVETVNINGCVARDTIGITITGVAPTAVFNTANVCEGLAMNFTDASFASNGDPVDEWLWSFGDNETSSVQNPSHVYASPGIYPVQLYVAQGGCGAFANATVQVFENPTASFSVNNTCFNQTTAFTSTSAAGTAEINAWLWNFGQPSSGIANSSVLPNPTRNYNELGTFSVSLLVTDQNNCSDEVTVPVTISESPVAQFTASDICAGTPITFTNTSSVTSPLIIQDHLWDFGDNTFSPMPSPNKTYNNIGFHTITLTVTASNGCSSTSQVQQFTHAYPVPNFTNGPACVGTWTTLTDVSTVETGFVASSSWEINLTNNLSGSPTAFVFSNSGPNNVKLTTTSDFGCTKDTMKIITVNPALNASFSTYPSVVISGDPVIFTNTTVGSTTGTWNFGDGNISTEVEPVHTYGTQWIDSVMNVQYVVSNTAGCIDTASVNLPVFKARFDLAVQNIFTDEENGFYNIGVNLRNMGTSIVNYADVELRLSNGTVLKDRYDQVIQGGQSVIMVFGAQPSAFMSDQDGAEAWICAEATPFSAQGLQDEDLTNNRFCKNSEGEGPVMIGPNPNPASEAFSFSVLISTESVVTVDLTDSRGRIVKRFYNDATLSKGLYPFTVPLNNILPGVYTLRLISGEQTIVRKLLVVN